MSDLLEQSLNTIKAYTALLKNENPEFSEILGTIAMILPAVLKNINAASSAYEIDQIYTTLEELYQAAHACWDTSQLDPLKWHEQKLSAIVFGEFFKQLSLTQSPVLIARQYYLWGNISLQRSQEDKANILAHMIESSTMISQYSLLEKNSYDMAYYFWKILSFFGICKAPEPAHIIVQRATEYRQLQLLAEAATHKQPEEISDLVKIPPEIEGSVTITSDAKLKLYNQVLASYLRFLNLKISNKNQENAQRLANDLIKTVDTWPEKYKKQAVDILNAVVYEHGAAINEKALIVKINHANKLVDVLGIVSRAAQLPEKNQNNLLKHAQNKRWDIFKKEYKQDVGEYNKLNEEGSVRKNRNNALDRFIKQVDKVTNKDLAVEIMLAPYLTEDAIDFIRRHWIDGASPTVQDTLKPQVLNKDIMLHQQLRFICDISLPAELEGECLKYDLINLKEKISNKINEKDVSYAALNVLSKIIRRYFPQDNELSNTLNEKLALPLVSNTDFLFKIKFALACLAEKYPGLALITALKGKFLAVENQKSAIKKAILETLAFVLSAEKNIQTIYKIFQFLNPNIATTQENEQILKDLMLSTGAWDDALGLLRAKGAEIKATPQSAQTSEENTAETENLLFNQHTHFTLLSDDLRPKTITAQLLANETPACYLWAKYIKGCSAAQLFSARFDAIASKYRPV